ncbi:MAG: hypothetical protein B7733_19150 [Myxococcales bacterium FL481]|nr:MAG: hypothetical protein B7733_19150 [Myxococcales bacterium FL481]
MPDGGYDYFDPHQIFVATIRPDGRVEIETPNKVGSIQACAVVLCGSVGTLRRPGEKKRRRRTLNPQLKWKATGDIKTWGPDEFGLMRTTRPIPAAISGGFGPPPDPNRSIREFLARTFEFRHGLVVAFHKRQLTQALTRLDDELAEIWHDPSETLVAKRRRIFEVWRDCDAELPEPEQLQDGKARVNDSGLDALRNKAARRARSKVVAFIRRYAPSGSAQAFSTEEIARFNRQVDGRERFAPYGDTALE